MADPEETETFASWREIQQESLRKVREPARRRRRGIVLLRGLLATLGTGLLVWACWAAVHWINGAVEGTIAQAEEERRVTEIFFSTDGVLSSDWLAEVWPEDPQLLGEIEVQDLRSRLLQDGQIAGAEVMRVAPRGLAVELRERRPILRLVAEDAGGRRRLWLVAGDGTVYRGTQYARAHLASLPFVAGAVLEASERGGFAPLAGMERISVLLDLAQTDAPDLFTSIHIVDLSRYTGNLGRVGESLSLVFKDGRRAVLPVEGLEPAFHRLGRIFEEAEADGLPAFQSVDLTLTHPVLVRDFSTPPEGAPRF